MKIWVIQRAESLPLKEDARKMRTTLLVDKLIERGHSVLWWTSAFDHYTKTWRVDWDTEIEVKGSLKVKLLKGIGYKRNISLSRFVDHRIIAGKFRRAASKMGAPDIVVASMPSHDLAYEAVKYAEKKKIPIIVDIRDKWPEVFLDYVPSKFRKLLKALLVKDFIIVKRTMRKADSLIAITKTLLEWGLSYAGRKKTTKDRVFYLGGKKGLSNRRGESEKIQMLVRKMDYKFVVIYIGAFGYKNKPSILLDCAKRLAKDNICFVLVGDGEAFKEIKERAAMSRNVVLTGWLDPDEITALLEHSHVGVCIPTPQADAFPNKAFAYLSAGLPVVSAFCGDMKDIIEKYQAGYYYSPDNMGALTDSIRLLCEDKGLYERMSENARKLYDEKFNSDILYEEYAKHIEAVAKMTKNEISAR